MTSNVSFALTTIATIGAVAFGISVLIVLAALVAQWRATKGAKHPEATTDGPVYVDLMEALKASLKHRTVTGPLPEAPSEGVVYRRPSKRRASGG
jgi:hypothetical protein